MICVSVSQFKKNKIRITREGNMLLPEGFRHVGDGRLDVDESRLQQLRVQQDLAEIYDIEESWFAK